MGRAWLVTTFIIGLLWIVAVVFIFKMIEDRKIAATVAGIGFFLIPILILAQQRQASRWIQFLTLQFWLLFAIPILFSRLIFWSEDFQTFQFFGLFTAEQWHRLASPSYLLMLAGLAVQIYFHFRQKNSAT